MSGAKYRFVEYGGQAISASEAASKLDMPPNAVFKTLVAEGKSGRHYVFMLPATGELNLKKAAAVTGEKRVEMLKSSLLLPLTGYVHGGCSPLGMKKQFLTYIHLTADSLPEIAFSAGRIGAQIIAPLSVLCAAIEVVSADLI